MALWTLAPHALVDEGRHRMTLAGGLASLQRFGQVFDAPGAPDGDHRFDVPRTRDPQLLAGTLVIEARHAVHDEAVAAALQGDVLPGRARIVGVRLQRRPGPRVGLLRGNDDEDRGVTAPGPVALIQEVEKGGPVR